MVRAHHDWPGAYKCAHHGAPPSPQVRGNHDWPGAEFPRSKATYAVRPQLIEVCGLRIGIVPFSRKCAHHGALFPTGMRLAHRHRALFTWAPQGAITAMRRACNVCNFRLEPNLPLNQISGLPPSS